MLEGRLNLDRVQVTNVEHVTIPGTGIVVKMTEDGKTVISSTLAQLNREQVLVVADVLTAIGDDTHKMQ